MTLGEKIKEIRIENNLKQNDLAELLYVSEKTISSWENNRTSPDLNMIYKISDYFKKSFYYLISDDYDTDNINEIEIKLNVNEKEYNRILNLIRKNSINKSKVDQIDTYYALNTNNEWLRIRNEDGKYIFNYKKKIDNSHYEKYDVLIDNVNNLNVILNAVGLKSIGIINKNRIIHIYKDKYEFSFDTIKDIGMFIEIELINKSDDFEKDFCGLLSVIEELEIDLNMVEPRKYVDYLGGL
jgi:adenylate cyclase class IV